MEFEFDHKKNERNISERRLSFTEVENFDFATAVSEPDLRYDYGEIRIKTIGYIDDRLHVLCFKPISRSRIRVISLRKANSKERKKYEKST